MKRINVPAIFATVPFVLLWGPWLIGFFVLLLVWVVVGAWIDSWPSSLEIAHDSDGE